MEWYVIFALLLIGILLIILGIILAYIFLGQNCTVSIQQRQANAEVTRIQMEEERKKNKKLSSRLKRAFSSKNEQEQPPAPIEDVKTVELTFKLGDRSLRTNDVETINEQTQTLITLPRLKSVTKTELEERQKKREEIRKKYNL